MKCGWSTPTHLSLTLTPVRRVMNNLLCMKESLEPRSGFTFLFFFSSYFCVCDIFLLEAFLEFRLSQATVVVLSGNSIFRAFCVCKQIPVNRLWISPSGRGGELAEGLAPTLKGALSTSPRELWAQGREYRLLSRVTVGIRPLHLNQPQTWTSLTLRFGLLD